MSRKTIRVGELAREADVDLDEALVTLWDAGIDQLGSANDLIPAASRRRTIGARPGRPEGAAERSILD